MECFTGGKSDGLVEEMLGKVVLGPGRAAFCLPVADGRSDEVERSVFTLRCGHSEERIRYYLLVLYAMKVGSNARESAR